jgi:hypothetical protein
VKLLLSFLPALMLLSIFGLAIHLARKAANTIISVSKPTNKGNTMGMPQEDVIPTKPETQATAATPAPATAEAPATPVAPPATDSK